MPTELKLLTREQFKDAVFTRDRSKCVVCGSAGVDAHHLLDRSLFHGEAERGGYFVDNGVTLCSPCHIEAEGSLRSVEDLRKAAGITRVIVPEHLDPADRFDKWSNVILPNGTMLRGEMFYEPQVQERVNLDLFSPYVKAPRTLHLPWSPGLGSDDKVLRDLRAFEGRRVIGTIKKDGENNSLYRDHVHARSLDGRHHPSRDWLRAFHAGMAQDIPEGWRVCGEGMFARHSIAYDDLPSYFLGFGMWDDRNRCLSWDETCEWFDLLGVIPVPVIFDGPFDLGVIQRLHEQLDLTREEGFVIRVADGFSYSQFRTHVAKYVRSGHVQTDEHWMHGPVIRNGLAD